MAKLSIVPFLLILAITTPLVIAVSENIPTFTNVDCVQRADVSGGDVPDHGVDGSMPSEDMGLESYMDEQLADDGLLDDEGMYIVMPTDDEQLEDAESTDDSNDDGKLGIPMGSVVTPAFFNIIISRASPSCAGKRFYCRAAFLNATWSYHRFGQLTPDIAAKREIAAFFAHVTHETGSLCYIKEIRKATYCDRNAREWPFAPRKQYYGRGPLQLTWNYNYGPCGQANRFDGLKNPDIVAKNRVMAWRASLWFWMKNVCPVLSRGFGATIKAINGGECNRGNPAAVRARVKYYRDYCRRFHIQPGSNISC